MEQPPVRFTSDPPDLRGALLTRLCL
jgi:hypothetical protein